MAKTRLTPEQSAMKMEFQMAYASAGTKVRIISGEEKGMEGIIRFSNPTSKGAVFGVGVVGKGYGVALWFDEFEVI